MSAIALDVRRRSPGTRGRRAASRLLLTALVTVPGGVFALATGARLTGLQPVVVTSPSMGTSDPVGSLVVARSASAARIRVGDAVIVRERLGATPILHRVTWRGMQDGQVVVRLKGDANPTEDARPVHLPSDVLRPALTLPLAGYLVAWSAGGWQRGVLLALMAATLMGPAVRTRFRARR